MVKRKLLGDVAELQTFLASKALVKAFGIDGNVMRTQQSCDHICRWETLAAKWKMICSGP